MNRSRTILDLRRHPIYGGQMLVLKALNRHMWTACVSPAIQLIQRIAKAPNAFDQLEKRLERLSRDDLSALLIECGIIPEMFAHDSSEEKLWAKYCDILLCKSLNHLRIQSEVLSAWRFCRRFRQNVRV